MSVPQGDANFGIGALDETKALAAEIFRYRSTSPAAKLCDDGGMTEPARQGIPVKPDYSAVRPRPGDSVVADGMCMIAAASRYAAGTAYITSPGSTYCWSMIFSENRYPLFGIML